jgi:hypothetical protein
MNQVLNKLWKILCPALLVSCAAVSQPGKQPDKPLDQPALTAWFSQRGLVTSDFKVENWPADAGASAGLPQRISFKTAKPSGELESWRTSLRDDLGAWLVDKKHPEGNCTSVDLRPEAETLVVEILIVCR